MQGWSHHQGRVVALPQANVDTDQLIPARFLSTPRAKGYGDYLLHDMRRDGQGQLRSDFALNRITDATILVAGPNFGTGSSREAAVYALADVGIRAIVAPSFGDIFAANAVNNGLLPARLAEDDVQMILAQCADGALTMQIDLDDRTLTIGNRRLPFALDDIWHQKLMNGWDDIDMTQAYQDTIGKFRAHRIQTAAWAWPAAAD